MVVILYIGKYGILAIPTK